MFLEKFKKQEEFIEKIRTSNFTRHPFYYILTMGCQLNENDSEKLCGMLEQMGYYKAEEMAQADIILFNTCCVRENAEEKLFGKLGEVKKLKEQKGTIVAVGGCMMQEEHIVERLKKSYPFCDIVFGTHTLYQFPQDLYEVLNKHKTVQDILQIDGEVIETTLIKLLLLL